MGRRARWCWGASLRTTFRLNQHEAALDRGGPGDAVDAAQHIGQQVRLPPDDVEGGSGGGVRIGAVATAGMQRPPANVARIARRSTAGECVVV